MSEGHYNFIPLEGFPTKKGDRIDNKAIAFWSAIGFMLDDDSFYEDIKWKGLKNKQPWYYAPKEKTLDEVTDEFAILFETIVREQLNGSFAGTFRGPRQPHPCCSPEKNWRQCS